MTGEINEFPTNSYRDRVAQAIELCSYAYYAQTIFGLLKLDLRILVEFQKDFGLELPEWTKKVFPDPLAKITAQSFVINAMTSVLQRLKGGEIVL